MRKPIRLADWVYLFLSFALSMWLVKAQTQDMTLSDIRLMTYHRMTKVVRRANIALMEAELLLLHMCNRELERRKY